MYKLAANKIVQQYFTAVEKGKSSGNRGYRLPEVFVNRRLPSLQELAKRWAVQSYIKFWRNLKCCLQHPEAPPIPILILNKKASQL